MQNNLLNTLIEVLKLDERFISNDWDLLKNTIREKAENLDENLISLLLDNKILREKFFIKIKDVIVFDNNKFIKFINNKEFLPDSYTSFKNKIGLTNEKGDFIASSNEVVLSFPFKDCVLAWWQDKDEQKRDEVFYNEILWQDDIDRLFDKKVFTNFKRINKDWEHKLEWFNRDENGTISDNLIIKWNNLLALHSLKSNFAWKVKLIYIDPPYNTWNDSFNYNDKFNHSTWLTFMKNRLEVAKELLRDDWVIFVHCDNNEQAYLKVLMDEIFLRDNYIGLLPRITKKAWKSTDLISNNNDFILIYYKNEISLNRLDVDENNYGLKDKFYNERWWFKLSQTLDYNSLQYNKTMDYEIEINNTKFYPGWIELFKEREKWKFNKIDWVWRWWKDKLKFWLENWFVEIKNNRIYTKTYSNATISKKDWNYFVEIVKREKNISSLDFVLNNEFSNDNSTKHIAKIFWDKNIFWYSKPEVLIKRIIDISTQTWDIVLDYHLWSGTTCAVAHKMKRQYIGIEQMDYIETISKERMKKVIEWEDWWISKDVEWKWWWNFVYMEIIQENESFLSLIKNASSIKDLLEIYNQIKYSEFISYKVDIWSLRLDKLEEKDFEDFKLFLIEILDKNMLYKNYSEKEDRNSWVNQDDRKLNSLFYNS